MKRETHSFTFNCMKLNFSPLEIRYIPPLGESMINVGNVLQCSMSDGLRQRIPSEPNHRL